MVKQLTILLVEDDAHDVELMKVAFSMAGSPLSLVSVHHGAEALKYLAGEAEYGDRDTFPDPAIVLLDLRMPVMDGFEVLRWMQTQPPEKMPPVIVMSYSRLEEDRRLARELGARSYEVKPVDLCTAVAFVKGLDGFMKGPVSSNGAP